MRFLIAALSLVLLTGCASAAGHAAREPAQAVPTAELMELYHGRDYFTLRPWLEALSAVETPELRFLRAAVEQAFNRPSRSLAVADSALAAGGLSDSLRLELARVQINNELRLARYADGAQRAEQLLEEFPRADSTVLDDVRNLHRMFSVLRDVPPQTVERHGATRLRLEGGHVPVMVNDSARSYVFDTGANLSTLMRSEARALGLRIIPAAIEVGSSTGTEVTADVAVAERLTIGGLEFHHVVFLVMDDSLLTFPDGFRIPGIIGFPVIEAMGEIRIRGGDTLVVPERVPTRTAGNLALQQLSPLTPVVWQGDTLVCRLDSGAESTQLYEPVYRRYGERIRAAGRLDTLRLGGAGGVRELEGYRLHDVRLAVGDTALVLDSTIVLTHSIEDDPEDNFLGCNLGHDVLDAFGEYIVNFRDMAFLLQ